MSLGHQLVRLGQTLLQPGGLHAMRTWKPFSLTSFHMLRALQQEGYLFQTIIDGGANIGQFARAAAETYPEAQIIAFEPLPHVFATLKANLRDQAHMHLIPSALGETDGAVAFHETTYSLSSSALRLHKNHRIHFPNVAPLQTVHVPIGRLDTLLANMSLPRPVLLKLDLQGYELAALKGASETLNNIDYILLEASFKPMYQGEPLFDDVYSYIRGHGFSLVQPLAFLKGQKGIMVQMDALFGKPAQRHVS